MSKVLLVAGDEDVVERVSEILKLAGHEVRTATGNKSAYQMALREDPDIIVCGGKAEGLDTYGFLYMINKSDQLHHIPFIFLSGEMDRSELRKVMESGADDYLPQPFTELELLNSVDSRLQKRKYFGERAIAVQSLNPSFGGIRNKEALDALIRSGVITHFAKKERIYAEGNYPHCLYYVHTGKARAYRTSDSGKELTTTLYKPGDFIGYKALLGETSYKESTETLEESDIGTINKEDFEELMYHYKDVAQQFVKILANNITEKEDRLVGLAYNSLRKRVANSILGLLGKYATGSRENSSIYISRKDLAMMAGTATESLIRTLGDFKNEGLIELKPGMIKVLDETGLVRMVN